MLPGDNWRQNKLYNYTTHHLNNMLMQWTIWSLWSSLRTHTQVNHVFHNQQWTVPPEMWSCTTVFRLLEVQSMLRSIKVYVWSMWLSIDLYLECFIFTYLRHRINAKNVAKQPGLVPIPDCPFMRGGSGVRDMYLWILKKGFCRFGVCNTCNNGQTLATLHSHKPGTS